MLALVFGARDSLSQAPPAPPPANGSETAPLPAKGAYRVSGDATSLSVFAVSVDAPELLTAIADKAGMRLLVDDTVSRRITVNVSGRTALQVVKDIASAYGLSLADVDGVTMISEGIPRSPSSYLLSDIAAIRTKYVNAANARSLLPVFLQDYVKVNSEQNAVVLSGPADVLAKFRDDIAQFDIPPAQIMVELLVVELTNSSLDQLGLKLDWQNAGRGISSDATAGTVTYRAVTALPNLFSARLRALCDTGKARVHANPRIATVSGRRSVLFVGRQRYVMTPIDSGERGGQRNYIDAGVRLRIIPYTGGKGQVLVDVDAEVSTLSAPDPTTKLPEKNTRTASTVIRVPDGQTIVIGGLTQEERREVRTKVPILGDVPLIGPLVFQTRDTRVAQTELAIFITPRVLSDTGHLPAADEDALRRRFLDRPLDKVGGETGSAGLDPSASLKTGAPAPIVRPR